MQPAYIAGTVFANVVFTFRTTFLAQVEALRVAGQKLECSYAGDDLAKLQEAGKTVLDRWLELLALIKRRAALLSDALDKFRFCGLARDLLAWMESTIKQMDSQEKPK